MPGIAFLFPGQGSQHVGMGKGFYDALPSVRRLFDEASARLGKDFARLCFEGPEPVLAQTEHAQPALTLVSLSAWLALREAGVEPVAVAGHSVGEYAALVAAGVMAPLDALQVVQVRGDAMRDAAAASPGGMLAVMGLPAEALADVCSVPPELGSVDVANFNSRGQTALTGTAEALKHAGATAKARGAKLTIPLKVSGPWHSRYMAPAQAPVRSALARVALSAPAIPVIANLTAAPYGTSSAALVDALVEQVVRPVRWVESIERLSALGCDVVIEAGPGKVLTGLMKDITRDVRAFTVQDPAMLEQAVAALRA